MCDDDYENCLNFEVGDEFNEENEGAGQKEDIDDSVHLREFEKYYSQKPLAQVLIDEVISAPLVGLEFILEVQKSRNLGQCSFVCTLCEKPSVSYTLIAHSRSLPHRLKLVEKQFPGIFKEFGCTDSKNWTGPRVKQFNNILEQIEKKVGRNTLAVTNLGKKDDAIAALRRKIAILPKLSVYDCVSYSSFEEQQKKIKLAEAAERRKKDAEIKQLQEERRRKLEEEAKEKDKKEKEMIQRYRDKQTAERKKRDQEREEREREREVRMKQRDDRGDRHVSSHDKSEIRRPLLPDPRKPALLPDPKRPSGAALLPNPELGKNSMSSPGRPLLNRNKFDEFADERDWKHREKDEEIANTLQTVTERIGNNRIGPKINLQNAPADMDVEIYEEDAEEALPLFHSIWKQKKVILIGDEICRNFGHPSEYIPDVVIKSKKKVTINDVIEMVEQNVNQNFDYVIIFPFQRTFLNLVKLGLHQGSPVMIEAKDSVPTSLLPEVMSYTKVWRAKYPCTEFIWALPYPLDFHTNNVSRELASYKGNPPANFQSVVKLSDSLAHSHKYYNNLVLFRNKWDRLNPGVPYIDTSTCFLKSSEEAMMKETCIPIIWPEGLTMDGVLPSPKFASEFWKKAFDVLFDLWSNKFFKVTKGIRSLTFAEDRNLYPKGDHFARMDVKTKGSDDICSLMNKNVLFVGDESNRSLMSVRDMILPKIKFVGETEIKFQRTLDLVTSNLNAETDMVLVSPFVGESVYFQENLTTNIRLAAPNMIDLRNLFPQIHKAHKKWENRYPNAKIIWVCPFPMNFEALSKNIISGYSQKNPTAAVIQNNLKLRAFHSIIYYNKLMAFARQWLVDIPDVPFIFSTDIMLTDEQRISFVDCKLNLQWPHGWTWDGCHALPKLANEFWNVILKLNEGLTDPNYIIQRHFLLKKKLDKFDVPKAEQNSPSYMGKWGEFWALHSVALKEVSLDPNTYDFTEEWNYAWTTFEAKKLVKEEKVNDVATDPRYNEEYAKFWKRRCAEVQMQGRKLVLMDIKKDWYKFWEVRSKELDAKTASPVMKRTAVSTKGQPVAFEVKAKVKETKQIDEEKWKKKIEENEMIVQQMEKAQEEADRKIREQLERKVKPILKGTKRQSLLSDPSDVKAAKKSISSNNSSPKDLSKLKNYINQSYERQQKARSANSKPPKNEAIVIPVENKIPPAPMIVNSPKPSPSQKPKEVGKKSSTTYTPIRCMTMLCELSDELGYLGPAILVMHKEIMEMESQGKNAMSVFDESENASLIHFAIAKFKKIISTKKDELDPSDKFTFEAAISSCEKLLQFVGKDSEVLSGDDDVEIVAAPTVEISSNVAASPAVAITHRPGKNLNQLSPVKKRALSPAKKPEAKRSSSRWENPAVGSDRNNARIQEENTKRLEQNNRNLKENPRSREENDRSRGSDRGRSSDSRSSDRRSSYPVASNSDSLRGFKDSGRYPESQIKDKYSSTSSRPGRGDYKRQPDRYHSSFKADTDDHSFSQKDPYSREAESSRKPPSPPRHLDFNDATAIKSFLEKMQRTNKNSNSASNSLNSPNSSGDRNYNSNLKQTDNFPSSHKEESSRSQPSYTPAPFESFNTSLKVVSKQPLLQTPRPASSIPPPANPSKSILGDYKSSANYTDKGGEERMSGSGNMSSKYNSWDSNSERPKMPSEYGKSLPNNRFDSRQDSIFGDKGNKPRDGYPEQSTRYPVPAKPHGFSDSHEAFRDSHGRGSSDTKSDYFSDQKASESFAKDRNYRIAEGEEFSDRRASGFSERATSYLGTKTGDLSDGRSAGGLTKMDGGFSERQSGYSNQNGKFSDRRYSGFSENKASGFGERRLSEVGSNNNTGRAPLLPAPANFGARDNYSSSARDKSSYDSKFHDSYDSAEKYSSNPTSTAGYTRGGRGAGPAGDHSFNERPYPNQIPDPWVSGAPDRY